VIREGNSLLLKVGVIMMALALAFLVAAVVVRVTLGSEPQRVVAADDQEGAQRRPLCRRVFGR
jgi:hypothetical protein